MALPYQYQPLRSPATQIRLLELLPGRGIIQCRLKAIDLNDAKGTYEPISYCWKSFTRRHWWGVTYKEKKRKKFRIQLDGADFYISESLRAALQQMRLKTEIRLLWADAICINQADDDEKSTQVTMMGTIYQNGKQTLVWLGDADYLTGRAFRLLKSVSGQTSELPKSTELYYEATNDSAFPSEEADPEVRHPRHLRRVCEMYHNISAFVSFTSILYRPYFERAWIVQEVVSSENIVVMCGRHEITRDELYKGVYKNGSLMPTKATLIKHSIVDLRENPGLYCLDTIINKLSHTKTADPRDKLYSALGLHQNCKFCGSVPIVVSYAKDVDEVFLEATKLLLSRCPSLDLLSMSYGTSRPGNKNHVPSWVWNPQPRSTEFHVSQPDADATNPFKSSQRSRAEPQFRGRILGLLGYVVEHLETVGQAFPADPVYSTHAAFVGALQCYMSWVDLSQMYEQGITEEESRKRLYAFFATLRPLKNKFATTKICYPGWNEDEDARSFAAFHTELFKRLGKYIPPGEKKTSVRVRLEMWAAIQSFPRQVLGRFTPKNWLQSINHWDASAVLDRCFVTTETGIYGLCPGDTKPGDKIVLLQGANVPFVLRPSGSGKNWTLVGECYLHGAMFGERWDQDRCEMLWIE